MKKPKDKTAYWYTMKVMIPHSSSLTCLQWSPLDPFKLTTIAYGKFPQPNLQSEKSFWHTVQFCASSTIKWQCDIQSTYSQVLNATHCKLVDANNFSWIKSLGGDIPNLESNLVYFIFPLWLSLHTHTKLQMENSTWPSSSAAATALILPTDDLALVSKHSTAPSSPPQATNPWRLLFHQ